MFFTRRNWSADSDNWPFLACFYVLSYWKRACYEKFISAIPKNCKWAIRVVSGFRQVFCNQKLSIQMQTNKSDSSVIMRIIYIYWEAGILYNTGDYKSNGRFLSYYPVHYINAKQEDPDNRWYIIINKFITTFNNLIISQWC